MELHSQQVRALAPESDPLKIGMGWTIDDLSKPQIMVESPFGDSHPGSAHLDQFVRQAVQAVNEHGGKAARYFATDLCDGIAQGHDGINYSLAHREAIVDLVAPFLDWTVPNALDGWVRDVSNGGLYLNKKNIPRKADKGSLSNTTQTNSTAKNFHLIRYADVLLWYAETLIELGQPQQAGEYINQVRARAANSYVKAVDPATMTEASSTYVLDDKINGKQSTDAAANYRIGLYPPSQFASKDKALEALRWERRIELAMEGHRWYDLARWGIASEVLNDFVKYEAKHLGKYSNSTYNAKWATMPIPHNEILKMDGLLVQNENWK